jgi:hypothetical protein
MAAESRFVLRVPPGSFVMPALVAGIHVLLAATNKQGVDGRDEPGHDERERRFDVTEIHFDLNQAAEATRCG